MKIDPKTDTLWKTYLVYFLILVFGIAIIVKIVVVQTKDSKKYVELAKEHNYRIDTLEAARGNIFSADGQLLATSVPVYDVFFDFLAIDSTIYNQNVDSLCLQMAQLLPKRNPEQWKGFLAEGRVGKHKRYYKIALNISQAELRMMQDFSFFKKYPNTYSIQ